jgi:hypothetical protein
MFCQFSLWQMDGLQLSTEDWKAGIRVALVFMGVYINLLRKICRKLFSDVSCKQYPKIKTHVKFGKLKKNKTKSSTKYVNLQQDVPVCTTIHCGIKDSA